MILVIALNRLRAVFSLISRAVTMIIGCWCLLSVEILWNLRDSTEERSAKFQSSVWLCMVSC